MNIVYLPITEIRPYPNNAKKHPQKQVEQVAESIRQFGFNQPVVIDKEKVIIVGHGRMLAAQHLGMSEVPTLMVDISEEKAKAYRLADNKLNESEWDMKLVVEELKTLSAASIDLTGFERDIVLTATDKDDRIPGKPSKENVRTSVGDLYEFGGHRILCGDSTSANDIDKLMGGETAKIIFTSPPYNMGASLYANYKDDLEREKYIDFNMRVIREFTRHLKGFVFWNISYNKNTRDAFIEIMYRITKESGLTFLELIVWNKKHALPITSKDVLTRQYEDILLAGEVDTIASDLELFVVGKNERGSWFNKKTNKGITNYWEIGTNNTQIENHGACFPVALPLKGISLMSSHGDIVVDPFLGTGSTMIAAEKSGRRSFGMEMDPGYVDVCVARWVEYTGVRSVKKNGKDILW